MSRPPLVVLGIDPGSVATGYGVVAMHGSALVHVESGVVRTETRKSMGERLDQIFLGLSLVIARAQPREAAIETLYHSRNVVSALKLGQARGVALLASARGGLDVHEYAPSEVKKAVVGHGGAEKAQVQQMVAALLGLRFEGRFDTTDALALAICHLNTAAFRRRQAIAEAAAPPRRTR